MHPVMITVVDKR